MNSKVIGTVVVIAAFAGVAGWWATRPPATEPEKVAAAPAPKAEAPKPAPRPAVPAEQPKPRVELPVAPAVAVQPVPAAAPAKTDKPSTDPQSELSTMFPDLITRLQAGDFVALMRDYMPPGQFDGMPPEARAMMEQQMQQMSSDPRMQQEMQMMVTVVQSLQNQTPTMNEAGDVATYQVSDPTGRSTQSRPFRFKKISGRWYVGEDL